MSTYNLKFKLDQVSNIIATGLLLSAVFPVLYVWEYLALNSQIQFQLLS